VLSFFEKRRGERPEPQLGLAPHVDSDDPPARLPVAAKTHTHRPYTDGASCCLGHGTPHATAAQLVTCSSGPWNGTASTGLDCTSHRALTPLTRPAGCAFAAAVRCRSDVPIRPSVTHHRTFPPAGQCRDGLDRRSMPLMAYMDMDGY
jgi:hypothetical protein